MNDSHPETDCSALWSTCVRNCDAISQTGFPDLPTDFWCDQGPVLFYSENCVKSNSKSPATGSLNIVNNLYKFSLKVKVKDCVGPGLATVGRASWQHRYSESTSSNPQQPHLCNSVWGQNWLHGGCQEVGIAVAPEVDLGECTLRLPSAMQKRQPTLALKPREDVTRNPKQGYQ